MKKNSATMKKKTTKKKTITMAVVDIDDEPLNRFQEATLLSDMENSGLSRGEVSLRMLTIQSPEKATFYHPDLREKYRNKLWNYKRMKINSYIGELAAHNVPVGPGTLREKNGIQMESEVDVHGDTTATTTTTTTTSSSPTCSIASASGSTGLTKHLSNSPSSTSSNTAGTHGISNTAGTHDVSNSLNNPVDLNQELENLTQKLSQISLKASPARPASTFLTKGNVSKPSHSSTKRNSDMSSTSSSPSDTPQCSSVGSSSSSPSATKHSNKTPSVSTPPRTIHSSPLASSMSSCAAGFSLPSMASASLLSDAGCSWASTVTIDPMAFAFEKDDVDYEGSKHNPFICCINTKAPERNRDAFHGHEVTLKRSAPNGDEYLYKGVVVMKTGNSADIIDLELWEATIPKKGDFPRMADADFIDRSLLVNTPALDFLQRDAEKVTEGRDQPCQQTLEAVQATTTRYNEYGSNGKTHGEHAHQKKYYLLIFEKPVDFSYLSHDSNCRTAETHSNIATFKENHRDLWAKIVNTIKQDMTNAYWEVPFVGGRTKVVAKMTPKEADGGTTQDGTRCGPAQNS
jgi:hypothetical protein